MFYYNRKNHDVLIYVVNLFQIKLLTNTGCLKEALIVCQTAVNAHKDVLALWISLLTMMMTNQKETEKIQATLEEAQKVIPKKVRTLIDLHLSSIFFLLFFLFFGVQLLSVLRCHTFFHPHHNGQ